MTPNLGWLAGQGALSDRHRQLLGWSISERRIVSSHGHNNPEVQAGPKKSKRNFDTASGWTGG